MFPSLYPLNIKLFSLFNSFNFLKAFFKTSVPFISSEPTFNKDNFGIVFGNKDLYKADPNSAKSTRFFSSHSIFAPRSKTTFKFFTWP